MTAKGGTGVDTRLYLDVNRFAQDSRWLHGFMHLYVNYLGFCLLGACFALAVWRSREAGSEGARPGLAALSWCLLAAGVTVGVAELARHLIGRTPPYLALHGVEVLTGRSSAGSLPAFASGIAAVAVLACLWARRYVLAGLSFLLGLLLSYGLIYVGAYYPSDVLAGAGFGIVIVALGLPIVALINEAMIRRRVAHAAVSDHFVTPVVGPAAHPEGLASSGAVRLLGEQQIRPRVAKLDGVGQGGMASS